MKALVFLFLVASQSTDKVFSLPMGAAYNYRVASTTPTGEFVSVGVISGGEEVSSSSLISLKRELSAGASEEFIKFGFVGENGKPFLGQVGYFHLSIEENPARIVLDFPHVQRVSQSYKKLSSALAVSPFVVSSEIFFDSAFQSTQVVLLLRKAMEVEVYQDIKPRKSSELVLHLRTIPSFPSSLKMKKQRARTGENR